jgi:hypothetical protein
MNQLQTRLAALEQQMHTVNRRLRWWRGLAGGLLVMAVLTWALPVVTADNARHDDKKGLEQRVADLEKLLKHFSRDGNEITITGANLHIVNGLGMTNTVNGLGNLIVGYNEPRSFGEEEENPNNRTGSHNTVVGKEHNFASFGGLVVGLRNEISGEFAAVSGGSSNTASGLAASVSGGSSNTASDLAASVSGGEGNTASRLFAAVSGGLQNTASEEWASVSGGERNTASGFFTVISGGAENTASGNGSTVCGGAANTASGEWSAVSGGAGNTASGVWASVSGGREVVQEATDGWAAGSFGGEVAGSFRSP